MALIRKRLRVEMWMYDQVRVVMVMEMVMVMVVEMVMVNCHHIINLLCQLQTLYTEEEGAPEVEIDLDEVENCKAEVRQGKEQGRDILCK